MYICMYTHIHIYICRFYVHISILNTYRDTYVAHYVYLSGDTPTCRERVGLELHGNMEAIWEVPTKFHHSCLPDPSEKLNV